MADVFLSYSRKDRKWVDKLREVLKPLVKDGSISLWYDATINPGEDWKAAVEQSLSNSAVAILLLSQNYFSSKLVGSELTSILERSEKGQLQVFSLITSPISWPGLEGSEKTFNPINAISAPLTLLSETQQKEILDRLAELVSSLFPNDLSTKRSHSSSPKDDYSIALDSAIENIGGDVAGSNILGDGNIFFEAEEKLEKKHAQ